MGRVAGPRESGSAHSRGMRCHARRPGCGCPSADASRPPQRSSESGSSARFCSRRLCCTATRWNPASALGILRQAARHRPRQCASLRTIVGTGDARPDTLAAAATHFRLRRHRGGRPCELHQHVRTDGLAQGIVHAHHRHGDRHRHEVEDGERFHGMGEWAWAAGIAPLLGPWRLGALQCAHRREGGFEPQSSTS